MDVYNLYNTKYNRSWSFNIEDLKGWDDFWHPKQSPALINLNKILKELEFGESFVLEGEGDIRYPYLIKDGLKIRLSDASSGFKQLFPILVKFLITLELDILLLEQPELHLHPKLQSMFIETLVKYYNQQQFVIETHSEHFIKKIQVLIAKKEISKDDVKVYYFNPKGKTIEILDLRLDDRGFFIDEWPNGFFDEASELSLQLIEALRNRNN